MFVGKIMVMVRYGLSLLFYLLRFGGVSGSWGCGLFVGNFREYQMSSCSLTCFVSRLIVYVNF